MISNVLDLLNEGAITLDDISALSEELQEKKNPCIAEVIFVILMQRYP